MQYSFSPRTTWRRFKANKQPVPRWMNLVRALSSEGRGRYLHHTKMRNLMATDREFIEFFSGESTVPPSFYHKTIKEQLGPFYVHLPVGILDYLDRGRPSEDSLKAHAPQENLLPVETVNAVDMVFTAS